jgi:hypothetical protein
MIGLAKEKSLHVGHEGHNKRLVYLEALIKLPPFEIWFPIVVS